MQRPIAFVISALRASKTKMAYRLIGGRSPILEITEAQARALEESLNSRFKVYVGMRYWHPYIKETLIRAINDGAKRLLALSLYPHYSTATTGSAIREYERVIREMKEEIEVSFIRSWYDHPFYIEALVDVINKVFVRFGKIPVLFSAHSLPQRFIIEGDPYLKEIKGTIGAITDRLEMEYYLSFQSKSGPVKWLEPSTDEMLHSLARKGIKNLLIVPISFVSDHIETLYEIDILYKGLADKLSINLIRTESLNTHPLLIEALKDIVIRKIEELGWTG